MAARRERWSRIVKQAESSGLSLRQFCEKHDVDEGQFYHWRHRLELEGAQGKTARSAEPGFVLVQTPGAADQVQAAALELILERGWRLRIPPGVEEAALRVVLDALTRRP